MSLSGDMSLIRSSHPNSDDNIVEVSGGLKTYSKRGPLVLDGIDMNLRKGETYGLLGASGCGKTTILSCLIGLRKLDKGTISVFGGTPGDPSSGVPGVRVGYMPQELALYTRFNVEEILRHYGRIYGMKKSLVNERITFLLDLLQLECMRKQKIETLSGGQKRRVSFAVALVHNPELLILDEPTVGVDPMLRKSIWDHLRHLTTHEMKTVLITTHYIEEAGQADVVGLMRDGKLLAENSPKHLLNHFQAGGLEEVFRKLCVGDNSTTAAITSPRCQTDVGLHHRSRLSKAMNPTNSKMYVNNTVYPGSVALGENMGVRTISCIGLDQLPQEKGERYPKLPTTSLASIGRIWALILKNIMQFGRKRSYVFFALLLPILEAGFFGLAIGHDPHGLKIGVANLEMKTCDAYRPEKCDFYNLSCRLLDHIFGKDGRLLQVPFGDEESALSAADATHVLGVLSIPANFSKNFANRLSSTIDVDVDLLLKSSVNVRLDYSNQQVLFVMKQIMLDGYWDFYRDFLKTCNISNVEGAGESPLLIGEALLGGENSNFRSFMAPGMIIMIVFFLAMSLMGDMQISERKDGLTERAWVAGVQTSEVVIAEVLTFVQLIFIQTLLTLAVLLLCFDIRCDGPLIALAGLTISQAVVGMTYGMVLAAICDDQASAMMLNIGSFNPNLVLSGILWPVEGMHWFFRKLSWWLPSTAACTAMRDVMNRGFDGTQETVYLGFILSFGWIIVFLILSGVILKLKR